jgi:hypothetical protein
MGDGRKRGGRDDERGCELQGHEEPSWSRFFTPKNVTGPNLGDKPHPLI